jgi:plastocyanin
MTGAETSMKSLVFLAMAVTLVVCAAPALVRAAADERTVNIEDLKYKPAEIKIKVGETVAWTNNDDREHTITADDNSFKSGPLRTGKTYRHKFTSAGRYPYHDDHFGRMKGVVVVEK